MLENHDMTIERNCIRTWFFVRDVDILYKGMVEARKANFFSQGMTEKTHFIASTGIGGVPQDTRSILVLDTYAIKGIANNQQHYLYARTHLNPTSEYGVTFERGAVIEYGDRKHVIISGTASINNKGEVVHAGDIVKQTHRMWENVETLLKEGGATYNDVMQIIVYLRDTSDYNMVKKMFEEKFPQTPYVITLAPVCRPKWLVEMECMAVIPNSTKEYKDF
jgi:enamine deaminase RidA (YjgF/YER057c/UK114 family)